MHFQSKRSDYYLCQLLLVEYFGIHRIRKKHDLPEFHLLNHILHWLLRIIYVCKVYLYRK